MDVAPSERKNSSENPSACDEHSGTESASAIRFRCPLSAWRPCLPNIAVAEKSTPFFLAKARKVAPALSMPMRSLPKTLHESRIAARLGEGKHPASLAGGVDDRTRGEREN